jgi:hypothetical protein
MKMRYWGRHLGIFYAVASLLFTIGSTVYSQAILKPAVRAWQEDVNKWMRDENKKAVEAAKNGKAAPPPPPPMMASNPAVDAVLGTVTTGVELLYPLVILILLLLPSTGKAFAIANGDAPAPMPEPEDYHDRRPDDFEDPLDRRVDQPLPSERSDDYRFRARDD